MISYIPTTQNGVVNGWFHGLAMRPKFRLRDGSLRRSEALMGPIPLAYPIRSLRR